jgi:uncharacterized membrane protein YhaH (DUF805 family)
MNWFIKAWRQYGDFYTRARRREFWYFVLFSNIVAFILGFCDGLFDLTIGNSDHGILSTIYLIAVFIPYLAVFARRLHDTGRSGKWLFFALIPLVGIITLLVFCCTKGEPEENDLGPSPLTEDLPDITTFEDL